MTDDTVYALVYRWPELTDAQQPPDSVITRRDGGTFPDHLLDPVDGNGVVLPGVWSWFSTVDSLNRVTYIQQHSGMNVRGR